MYVKPSEDHAHSVHNMTATDENCTRPKGSIASRVETITSSTRLDHRAHGVCQAGSGNMVNVSIVQLRETFLQKMRHIALRALLLMLWMKPTQVVAYVRRRFIHQGHRLPRQRSMATPMTTLRVV